MPGGVKFKLGPNKQIRDFSEKFLKFPESSKVFHLPITLFLYIRLFGYFLECIAILSILHPVFIIFNITDF